MPDCGLALKLKQCWSNFLMHVFVTQPWWIQISILDRNYKNHIFQCIWILNFFDILNLVLPMTKDIIFIAAPWRISSWKSKLPKNSCYHKFQKILLPVNLQIFVLMIFLYRRKIDFIYSLERNLTHWGRVMHICISNLTIIGSDNGLTPGWRQAIIWTNAGILLKWNHPCAWQVDLFVRTSGCCQSKVILDQ